MNYSEVRKLLDAFHPRMVIKIDKLDRHEKDYGKVLNVCREALRKGYEVVVNESNHTIEIGKAIE